MKKIIFFLLYITLISFFAKGQIVNGGFEQWASGEPVGWQTNNINEPKITLTPITQSSFAQGGSSALKGEVLEIPMEGPSFTHAPILVSGNLSNPTFSYNGRPESLRGFYNFQSVGGDGFVANAFLLSGETPVAVSGFTTNNSTGPGYHELLLHFTYVDTVTIPDAIQILFQISPAPGQTFANVGSTFYIDDFPRMTLIKPEESLQEFGGEQPVFIAGEVDTIKWNSGGAMNIDIKYSTDNGSTFQSIVNSYPGDSSRYFWAVPGSLLTREAQIKIVESQNTGNEIESIDFTIKPWQLTKIDGSNNLELFEPNQDGWNFSNARSNVWPRSWWQQFDYSGTDPFTGVDYPWWLSPFSTADSSDFPDWELFVEVFGVDKCYIQVQNTLIYNPIATAKWGAFILGIRNDWGGSCFGFAISSLLYFYHKSELISKFPNLSNQSQLYTVSLDSVSRRVVNHYFIHQFGIENTLYTLTHKLDSPRELLDELKNMFRNENGDGRALSYFDNSLFGTGGHSVTPFKMERLGSSSVFDLHLYDSRAPGVTTQVIQVDSGKNEWTDVTGLNYGSGSSGCYLEPESSEFFTTPSIVSPLSMLNPESSLSGGAGAITIYNTSQAEITITSSSGNQIGFQDSLVHNTFSDAVSIIPKTTSFHPPIGYLVPEDNYSILMNGYTDSLSYVFFFTDSTIYNYYRRTSLSDEEDYLNLNNGVVGITNPDQISKKIELETILVQNEVGEKVFFVSNINLSLNDSIKMHEVDRKNLLFQNYGDAMNYDLQVRSASANGQFIFSHISIPMAQNSAHQIVPVWTDLNSEPITIFIDLGNDGTIDDTIFVKNQATNIEDEGSLLSPDSYNLAQNFPNPFNPSTSIRYSIPQRSNVSLKVYDILGNEVAVLVNEEKDQGVYTVTLNAAGLSSGIYFYKLQSGSFVETKKMLLIK